MQQTAMSQPFRGAKSRKPALPQAGPPAGRVVANDQVFLACEDNLAFMEKLSDDQMKLVV